MAKVKFGFAGLSVSRQLARSRQIHKMISGNPHFPSPNPTMAALKTATDDLENYYNLSRDGNLKLMKIMRYHRAAMLALLRRVAEYVQAESQGVGEIILTSGFEILPQRGYGVPVGRVFNLRNGKRKVPRGFRPLWDKVPGALVYEVELSDTDASDESFRHFTIATKTRINITGLEPGRIYWIRVRAIGRKGYGTWSNVAVVIAGR